MKKYNTILITVVFFTIFSFAAPPANDNFSARITLTGTSGVVTGTTVEATLETDEPVHAYSYGGNGSNSIWYSWTAPGTAKYTFETIKSDKNSFVCVDYIDSFYTEDSFFHRLLHQGEACNK